MEIIDSPVLFFVTVPCNVNEAKFRMLLDPGPWIASSSGLVHSADIYWALDWLIDFLLFLYLFCPVSITFDNVESEDWLPPQ